MSSLLQWEEIYCFQKFLPLLTRWQLFHYGSASQNLPLRGNVWPEFIKKKRAPRGVASYEIIWNDDQRCFDGLIPSKQIDAYLSMKGCPNDDEALQSLWSTIEPIDLVEKAYPDLVEKFVQSKIKPKKTKTTTRKPAKRTKKVAESSLHDMSSLQQAIDDIDVAPTKPKPKTMKKTTRKSPKVKKAKVTLQSLQTLDKFFRKDSSKKSFSANHAEDATPTATTVPTPAIDLFDFSIDFNDMDDGDCNLSEIISEIVSKPPTISEIGGKKLRFDEIRVRRTPSPPHYANEFDREIVSETNKENVESNVLQDKYEESFDEFDLIVMGKSRSKATLVENNVKSSTPLLMDRFLKKHSIRRDSSGRATRDSSPPLATAAVITTSFFSLAADGDIDLFEQSTDFRNMEDVDLVVSDSSDGDSVSDADEVEMAAGEN